MTQPQPERLRLSLPQLTANTHQLVSAFWASFLKADTCAGCELRLMWEVTVDFIVESMGYNYKQFAYCWGQSEHGFESFSVRYIPEQHTHDT